MSTREMKDSGIEWIGQIPKGWKVQRMKSIFRRRNEINKPVLSEERLSLSIDVGITKYSEKTTNLDRFKEDLTKYQLAYPKDIVLNSMNMIVGAVGISKYFGCVSPVYYVITALNDNDAKFYSYLLNTTSIREVYHSLGRGIYAIERGDGRVNTCRLKVPFFDFASINIPVPEPSEQRRIATFLDEKCKDIDTLIILQEQMIAELQAYKQSVISEAVTKGLNPNVRMKDSGVEWIGEIPEHWSVIRLRHLGNLQNGISKGGDYFGEGYPFLNYGDAYQNMFLKEPLSGLAKSNEEDQNTYSVKEGDVFFTRTSETVEEIGFSSVCLKTIDKAIFSGFLIRFRPSTSDLNSKFSGYYFRSNIHRRYFVKEMNLVTRASLGQNLLKNLPVILPPLSEQQAIADYLDTKCSQIDELITLKQQKITELQDYKKSLIYEYVTGKKEVPANN